MRLAHEEEPYLFGGRPWGLGAMKVDIPGKGWVCPGCGKKAKKDDGRHTYVDGDERCSDCARAWCDAGCHPTEVEQR